jgi:hypothetical protein
MEDIKMTLYMYAVKVIRRIPNSDLQRLMS